MALKRVIVQYVEHVPTRTNTFDDLVRVLRVPRVPQRGSGSQVTRKTSFHSRLTASKRLATRACVREGGVA